MYEKEQEDWVEVCGIRLKLLRKVAVVIVPSQITNQTRGWGIN